MIYIPAHDRSGKPGSPPWRRFDQCVWAGPEWLQHKQPLHACHEYSSLKNLFQVILQIHDAKWNDFLDELVHMKGGGRLWDENTVSDVYRQLWREFQHDNNWTDLRYASCTS